MYQKSLAERQAELVPKVNAAHKKYQDELANQMQVVIHENGNKELDGVVIKTLAEARIPQDVYNEYQVVRDEFDAISWRTHIDVNEAITQRESREERAMTRYVDNLSKPASGSTSVGQ